MGDTVYWIWFQQVFGVATRRAHLLLNYFGHPREIYEGALKNGRTSDMLDAEELRACEPSMEKARDIERVTLKKGCSIITPDDEDYPEPLQSIYAKPAALYVKGDLSCVRDALCIAMVGTRKCTEYGKRAATALSEELAAGGAVIISGLAPGVDSHSHSAAIDAGGKTIGIMGCGIDVDYPKGSAELKRAISRNGAVVTEFPLKTGPYAGNFPLRNRIISGMARGVVVMEADFKSGAIITANHALEQGRDIFAVPGSIFGNLQRGVHKLIKDGAKLVDSAGDIFEEYPAFKKSDTRAYNFPKSGATIKSREKQAPEPDIKPEAKSEATGKKPLPEGLTAESSALYDAFTDEALTAEELSGILNTDIGGVLSSLTELEIYGLVQALPGHRFTPCR